jgi:hypothetical protein
MELWIERSTDIMAQSRILRQSSEPPAAIPANGNDGHLPQDAFAPAEPAAPEQDLEDALGEEPTVSAPRAPAEFDLDDALGDENALKHDMVADVVPPPEVREPHKREYLTVHPTYARVATVVEYALPGTMERGYYLATGRMKACIEEEDLRVVRLVLCQSLQTRAWFIWPVKLDRDGKENAWNRSTERFVNDAKTRWARRVNRKTEYGTRFSPGDHDPPTWPTQTWKEILKEAFTGRVIDSREHPVFLALEGRV